MNTNGRHSDSVPTAAAPRFKFIGSNEFLSGDFSPTWLVKNILVAGEPAVVAGPAKAMKTSLVVDLAVSLASGSPFLGAFRVPDPGRVAVCSGESGRSTLQAILKRVMTSKGLEVSDLGDHLQWEFLLPVLSSRSDVVQFVDAVASLGSDVVIVDPLYLCLGSADPRNMFEVGEALGNVASLLTPQGITLILVHHASKQLHVGDQMTLGNIAYSGLEQFARQAILLNRREPYSHDGEHELLMSAGGSAGHGGAWVVHVSEGTLGEDFAGRKWDVIVRSAIEAAADAKMERDELKERQRRQRLIENETLVLKGIDSETSKGRAAATKSAIEKFTGKSHTAVDTAIESLLTDGIIVKKEIETIAGKGATRKTVGYARSTDHVVSPD